MFRPRIAAIRSEVKSDNGRKRTARSGPNRDAGDVRVYAFGACAIDVGETRLGRGADVLVSLMMILVNAPAMQMPRDQLTSLLWPDLPLVRRRANLRQALYSLRQHGVHVALSGDQVQLDVSQVRRNFSIERTVDRFDRYVMQGPDPFGVFLPGFAATADSPLADWLENERARAHGDVRRVLSEALRTHRDAADWKGAEPYARWLLQFDPLNEDATLVVAECMALYGARLEAIRVLDRYLEELGPGTAELRLSARTLRRRIAEPSPHRPSFAPTERHFMGREHDLADLAVHMRSARWNRGSATFLHGTAGMGKTRLTHELAKIAVIEGVRELRTGCRESDVSRPLSVFLELVPELLALPGALGCSPEGLQALRRFANADAGIESATREPSSGILSVPLAAGLRRSLVDLVAAVSHEKPLLLVCEDVHWIDAASWDVLVDLVDRIGDTRVFLLLTSRLPHARPAAPARMPLALRIVSLAPMSRESCLELARAIGHDMSATIDEELGEWFVHSSEGVPLFLRSLVNHWIESGDAGGIPPTLQGIIAQRLQALTPDALRLLQTVALLARQARLPVIERVLEMPYFRIVSALDDLQKAGAFDSDADQVLVCHELIGRMAVDQLGSSACRALHHRIAETLRNPPGALLAPALCRDRLEHLLKSGDVAGHVSASVEAAEELLGAGYSYDALGVAEAALEQALDEALRRRILALQAEALYSCGEYALVLNHPLSPPTISQGLERWQKEEPEALVRWLDAAFTADIGHSASDIGAAATLLSEIDRYSCAVRVSAASVALRIASNTFDEEQASRAYAAGRAACVSSETESSRIDEIEMLFHTPFGNARIAFLAATRAVNASHSMRNTSERLAIQSLASFAIRQHGDTQAARSLMTCIYREALRDHLIGRCWYAAWRLAVLELDEGNLHESSQWEDEFARVAPTEREPLARLLLYIHRARIALARGDADLAHRNFELAQGTMEIRNHLRRHAQALAIRLGIARAKRNITQQIELIAESQPIFNRVQRYLTQDYFASELTLAYQSIADTANARSILFDYLSHHRQEAATPPKYLCAVASIIGIENPTELGKWHAEFRVCPKIS